MKRLMGVVHGLLMMFSPKYRKAAKIARLLS